MAKEFNWIATLEMFKYSMKPCCTIAVPKNKKAQNVQNGLQAAAKLMNFDILVATRKNKVYLIRKSIFDDFGELTPSEFIRKK